MLVISDTSPITNLIGIGQLDLLQKLFDVIIIPEKVYDELSNYENQKAEIDKRTWIKVKKVTDLTQVQELIDILDAGEVEAIILAQELHAEYLIIDERKGRKVAEEYGLKITGLLGVLVQGKEKGHITKLKPILDKLVNDIGFRVSQRLYDRILEKAKE